MAVPAVLGCCQWEPQAQAEAPFLEGGQGYLAMLVAGGKPAPGTVPRASWRGAQEPGAGTVPEASCSQAFHTQTRLGALDQPGVETEACCLATDPPRFPVGSLWLGHWVVGHEEALLPLLPAC